MTSDAGAVDLLMTLHGTCETRECAAKVTLENGLSGEMGGGAFWSSARTIYQHASYVGVQAHIRSLLCLVRFFLILPLWGTCIDMDAMARSSQSRNC